METDTRLFRNGKEIVYDAAWYDIERSAEEYTLDDIADYVDHMVIGERRGTEAGSPRSRIDYAAQFFKEYAEGSGCAFAKAARDWFEAHRHDYTDADGKPLEPIAEGASVQGELF